MKELHGIRLVTHGLRKSACIVLAECGCTDAQIQSVTGQSLKMVQKYRKRADQKRLSKEAMQLFKPESDE